MELPAGGTFDGQIACNKALTKFGAVPAQQTGLYACDGDDPSKGGIGAMHTADEWWVGRPLCARVADAKRSDMQGDCPPKRRQGNCPRYCL